MQGSNAGIPVSVPANEARRSGPFSIWSGHPSPVPWFGKFNADPGYLYQIIDHESDETYDPVCHECIVGLIYHFRGFCDLTWTALGAQPRYCDWCDRVIH